MQKWEYQIVDTKKLDYAVILRQLNTLGLEGWEAVGWGRWAVLLKRTKS